MKNVDVICDLQFGSTGKGLIAGYWAKQNEPDVVVTAWSMNAGHTFIDDDGTEYVHCMLANGIVSPKIKYVLIGPGSQVGLRKLFEEVRDSGFDRPVYIHEHACIIQQRHIDQENETMTGIGSTKKGCGAALAEKIGRNPLAPIVAKHYQDEVMRLCKEYRVDVEVLSSAEYNKMVDAAKLIQVEGAQGFSLGINSGFYPYTTSRECTPAQIMVDCGLPIRKMRHVIGTMRTYPIRVANRYDDMGEMVGWSGPCYPDQHEISFEDLGVRQELTTVTQLPRRIFTFSKDQTKEAVRMVRPDYVFLNFVNYCRDSDEAMQIINTIDNVCHWYGLSGVTHLGVGPKVTDVVPYSGELQL